MKRPKLIAILLAGGFLVLIAGGAIAASLPSWPSHKATLTAGAAARLAPSASGVPSSAAPSSPDPGSAASTPSAAPSTHGPSARPTASKHAKAPKKNPRAKKPEASRTLTYVVKPGDTLSGIAAWFRLHGYTGLYDWNKSVIGSNPNLIFPGQRITISNTGVMTLGSNHS